MADAAGLEDALDGVDLVVTGEGQLDATSFEGKVVGGVLEWAADAGVPHVAVIAGQVTDEAREELAVRAGVQVLALTDRVWRAAEAFARAATLWSRRPRSKPAARARSFASLTLRLGPGRAASRGGSTSRGGRRRLSPAAPNPPAVDGRRRRPGPPASAARARPLGAARASGARRGARQ